MIVIKYCIRLKQQCLESLDELKMLEGKLSLSTFNNSSMAFSQGRGGKDGRTGRDADPGLIGSVIPPSADGCRLRNN